MPKAPISIVVRYSASDACSTKSKSNITHSPFSSVVMLSDLFSQLWRQGRRVEKVAYLVGALLFLSGLFHLGVQAIDGGRWEGPVSWRKPVSFGTSFGLSVITIAWVQTHLRMGNQIRNILLGSFAVVSIFEVVGATIQPWRNQPSHFNQNEGCINSFINDMMAAGAAALLILLITYSVYSLCRSAAELPMRVAIRYGFGILMVGMVLGVMMSVTRGEAAAVSGDIEAAYATGDSLKAGMPLRCMGF